MTIITSEEQLLRWVEGESIHDERGEGQCVPDFSCCRPDIKTSDVERRAFFANPEVRDSMLMTFLSNALATYDLGKDVDKPKVHLAGETNPEESIQ